MKSNYAKRAVAFFIAGYAALLCACGSSAAGAENISFAPASSRSGVEWLNDRAGGYSSTSGFYRTQLRSDQLAQNLLYIDFATGQELYLCSQPNCTHDSDSCSSWLSLSGALTRVIPVGEKVVILYGGNSYAPGENSKPHILLMNPDGSERKTLASFESTDMVAAMPRGGLARDEENLYFVLQSQDVNTRTLYAVNVVTEQVTPVCALSEEEEKIVGGAGSELVLSYTPGAYSLENDAADLTTQFIRLDPKTGTVTPLFSCAYLDTLLGCIDGKAYLLNSDGTLYSYDLQTGESAAVKTDLPAIDYINWAGTADGKGLISLIFQPTGEGAEESADIVTLYFSIDLASGRSTPLPYIFDGETMQQPMRIEAESSTHLLLLSGNRDVKVAAPGESEGEITTVSGTVPVYSLLSKEDFRAARDTAVPVKDSKT